MEFSELIKVSKVEDVVLYRPFVAPVKGTLCISSHHLLFSSGTEGTMELWLLIRNIDAVEKRLMASSGTITLKCKDFKILQLDITGMEECLNIASSIEALLSQNSLDMMYPFFFRPTYMNMLEGWDQYSPERELAMLADHTDAFRISYINKDFAVCFSYPSVLIVPKSIDDEVLKKSAKFRQGGRFPYLSYYHKKNGKMIFRSSQPLIGPNVRRCKEDEGLLGTIVGSDERAYVLDTRSSQSIQQAKVMGGGTESTSNYRNWKRLQKALERGRILQESLIKLVEACNDQSHNMDRWLSKLENSKWLSHVQSILNAACMVAQCVEREEASVLVHGSEGTDTTLQVTSLAQVILDPDCRTLMGFQSLIEREWLQAGHPFQARCTRSAYSHAKLKQEAPTFLLFLDCCWQLMRQFPCSLEFNEQLLITLFEQAYASSFGTFLANNEKERFNNNVKEKTHSLWSWINSQSEHKRYINPFYSRNLFTIWPSIQPQSLQLWQGLFFRWNSLTQHKNEVWNAINNIINCEFWHSHKDKERHDLHLSLNTTEEQLSK
ncbi:myotubularin-related protein 9-like isoform X2 [Protopterus annectens]|uniref:myotubularin-related protein 9-like isoform X2 n=1 Tax=Protopterus annectens TaxID=7888 RepID=UPI001CF9370F|nr:myotubularin-related protein 9-like isoform X2 [Protopterus annectens]